MRADRIAAILFVPFVAITLLASCATNQQRRQPKAVVAVARAEQRDAPYSILASGTVEARQTAAVSPPVGGILRSVLFHEGQDVRAGQALFQIDPRPFESALAQARATLARDRAQARAARNDAERARVLVDQKMIADADWDAKRSAAEALEATVRADSALAANARLNLAYCTVRAPISGRSGKLLAHVGDLVKAESPDQPLVVINELSPILVRFAVPQSELALIQRHRAAHPPVWVTRPGSDSTEIEGHLTFVDNNVDQTSGTVLLKAEFPNHDGGLWPGAFVNARLVLFVEPLAIRVPSPAVVNSQNGTFVYVVGDDSTVAVRPVRVARTVDEWSILASGVHVGERVVTDGQLRLTPGARVTWKEPTRTAARIQ
ncbi:MAG TPA: efflux RND transporter periplasmic adaptor subunit [Candidatus Udaeobacter sp.]|jgi:multidrug efflux system membrane fusion protein|nr:efflux RND transporter periplasmic adaptor subunit [Candidatus Udaeobacter sp.]